MITPAQRVANTILAHLGDKRRGKDRTSPSLEDLEQLAREYLRLTGAKGASRLGLVGPYYVTEDAGLEFGAVALIRDDERAQRELAVHMHNATPNSDGSWRAGNALWDITARTENEATPAGNLILVVKTNTRPRNRGGR